MLPPEAPVTDLQGRGAGSAPAVSVCLETLRKRPDFLRAASARRQAVTGFLVQARERQPGEPAGIVRVGFTCSKKVGNSVLRNRARRRLREIARMLLPELARPGWDYVLIGRQDVTIARSFADLQNDLREAMARVHDAKPRPYQPRRGKG
ncbi:ribonuclease P protein component [Paenirhodobacter sp.]|uniref:ribonuclease P protein component n=1 Tax=Paenirhodobacter sp. TaxID=1965326 RepID=UPI003B3F51DF